MKGLLVLIVKHLRKELEESSLSPDAAERVKVAAQCIENAYSISKEDLGACTMALEDLYLPSASKDGRKVTPEQNEEAQRLKKAGNERMAKGKYPEAIELYTRAIALDPNNTVYFCNRAAAHILTVNFSGAINDCHEAIRLDPKNSKAHGRLGYAYHAVGDHRKSRDSYSKAHTLRPGDKRYKNWYQKLQEKLESEVEPMPEFSKDMDLSPLMKYPKLAKIATKVFGDAAAEDPLDRILSGKPLPNFQLEEELITATREVQADLRGQLALVQEELDSIRRYTEDLMANQEPKTEQLPSSSALPSQPEGVGPKSINAHNSLDVSGDGPSSSGLEGKNECNRW